MFCIRKMATHAPIRAMDKGGWVTVVMGCSGFPALSGQVVNVVRPSGLEHGSYYNIPMSNKTTARARAISTVTVYAASSSAVGDPYFEAARALGAGLAGAGMTVVYGGGSTGLMGAMADAVLGSGGQIHGVVPQFLKDLEVSHQGLTSLTVVNDMRERKHLMLEQSDAVVALPGGCGTYEEVFEALTLKRLGQWLGPIVLLNTMGFYDRLNGFLAHAVSEKFMDPRHLDMWAIVDNAGQVTEALSTAPAWSDDALQFATNAAVAES